MNVTDNQISFIIIQFIDTFGLISTELSKS